MANRYWVGNTGNWNDTAHWASSSGGAGGETVPTLLDSVYFDNNSINTNSVITIDSIAYFNTLTVLYTGAWSMTFEQADGVQGTGTFTVSQNGYITWNTNNYAMSLGGLRWTRTGTTFNGGTSIITITSPTGEITLAYVTADVDQVTWIIADASSGYGSVAIGALTPNLGDIIIQENSSLNISKSSDFECNNLTVYSGGIILIQNTYTFTVNGVCSLWGADGNHVQIKNTSGSTNSYLYVTNYDIMYTDVKDVTALGNTPINDEGGVNLGGAIDWNFLPASHSSSASLSPSLSFSASSSLSPSSSKSSSVSPSPSPAWGIKVSRADVDVLTAVSADLFFDTEELRATGGFLTGDGQIVTVKNGIIISIEASSPSSSQSPSSSFSLSPSLSPSVSESRSISYSESRSQSRSPSTSESASESLSPSSSDSLSPSLSESLSESRSSSSSESLSPS